VSASVIDIDGAGERCFYSRLSDRHGLALGERAELDIAYLLSPGLSILWSGALSDQAEILRGAQRLIL